MVCGLGVSMNPEKCAACGEPFECGKDEGQCWCFEIPVSDAMLKELREKYDRCLCQACLLLKIKSQLAL